MTLFLNRFLLSERRGKSNQIKKAKPKHLATTFSIEKPIIFLNSNTQKPPKSIGTYLYWNSCKIPRRRRIPPQACRISKDPLKPFVSRPCRIITALTMIILKKNKGSINLHEQLGNRTPQMDNKVCYKVFIRNQISTRQERDIKSYTRYTRNKGTTLPGQLNYYWICPCQIALREGGAWRVASLLSVVVRL